MLGSGDDTGGVSTSESPPTRAAAPLGRGAPPFVAGPSAGSNGLCRRAGNDYSISPICFLSSSTIVPRRLSPSTCPSSSATHAVAASLSWAATAPRVQ